jgi:hypothetical protein
MLCGRIVCIIPSMPMCYAFLNLSLVVGLLNPTGYLLWTSGSLFLFLHLDSIKVLKGSTCDIAWQVALVATSTRRC